MTVWLGTAHLTPTSTLAVTQVRLHETGSAVLAASAVETQAGFQYPLIVGLVAAEAILVPFAYVVSGWSGTYMTPDDSASRLGRKATWNVDGVDTDIEVTDFGNYFQLHLPGQAYPEELYSDEAWPGYSFITPDDSWKRLITIAPQTVAPYQIAVGPSYQAVEAQPELVTVPGVAGYDVFCGSNLYPYDGAGVFMAPDGEVGALPVVNQLPVFPSFLLPSTSDYRIFNRYAVFDPDDLPTGGTQGTMFCGFGFFDFPPFTAEVDVFMAGQRSTAEFAIDDFMMPTGRFTLPQDNDPIAYVAGAIEAARGLTSLTLLQPKPTPLFVAGAPFIVGIDHFVIGQSQLSV
jgi:hypothetical protein